MILVIDNYDSFTYNLVQYLGELTLGRTKIKVARNNEISMNEIKKLFPSHILISPGPCTPKEAGISTAIYESFAQHTPILGVCLGHQCLGAAYGGSIVRAVRLMHGKTSQIRHDQKGVYRGLPNPFTATRYHSLVIEKRSCPKILEITSKSEDGEIMGVRHKKYPWVEGVQFHPESILTQEGKKLLKNFLEFKRVKPGVCIRREPKDGKACGQFFSERRKRTRYGTVEDLGTKLSQDFPSTATS